MKQNHLKPKTNKKKFIAFTIVELLVVISVISLMATLILTGVTNARKKAKDAQTVRTLKTLKEALDLYSQENGGVYPCDPGVSSSWFINDQSAYWDSLLLTALDPYITKYLQVREGRIAYRCRDAGAIGSDMWWSNPLGCFFVLNPGYYLMGEMASANPDVNFDSFLPLNFWQYHGFTGQYVTRAGGSRTTYTTSGPCPPP